MANSAPRTACQL